MQEPNKKKVFDYSLLVRIYSYVKPYKHWFYFSLVLAILIAILAPIRPYLIQLTIDKATGKNIIIPTWLQFIFPSKNLNIAAQLVIWITIFQIVFIIFETIIRFVFSYLTAKLGQHIVKDLRVSVFKKILHLRLRQFDKTPIGTLTTRTINDIESINDIFSDGLIPIISDLLTIIFTVATMFWINWQLALIALIPFPFIIIATYYFKESVNASFIRVRNAVANLNAFVQEHLTGINIVQAFAAEEKEFKKFEAINQEHRSANIKAIFAYSVFFPVVELVLAVSIGLTVWFIAGKQLNPGLLIAFILYLNQIFKPLRIIADKFNVLQMGMIAAERVFKVLDNKDVEPTNNTSANILQLKGDITFNNVWFAYKPQQYVLKNISFNVQQGETVALIGHTGSGKTSIISILNKLYDIEKGEILIDDFNIDKINISTLRKNIAVVLQDVFLFAGTIKDNITLENKLITNEKVIEAAKLIGVHDFIMKLPDNYNFNVGERGNSLSMGQKQLISFIRALLYNPSILILDEATSSIDSESEILIQKATEQLIKNRTSIIIAHRLSTIKKANKIIVLDNGEIKEIGSHEELINKNGYYTKLYNLQFNINEKILI
ncbi:MAG TPA: ABC transporter ATP-binding protein [Chitinophagaceae bacterium]|nr:ABC transporter ATP-binding protein/permease [Chitinophagaceae bacterium]MCC6635558.1 ABC transporter ATP-binding protein [Chitinophagaceae bacterium]HMZ46309.1 ABC transporter ATP-binding protein [Chitinophagaceae bacterium]HNE93237.1 ABC transporter ATP-binding protein [Chitinophagaceae bacterium]HNM33295.1 ABC transporter ATP-binding protein [Chitinophagaceae bacterium]